MYHVPQATVQRMKKKKGKAGGSNYTEFAFLNRIYSLTQAVVNFAKKDAWASWYTYLEMRISARTMHKRKRMQTLLLTLPP